MVAQDLEEQQSRKAALASEAAELDAGTGSRRTAELNGGIGPAGAAEQQS